MAECVECGASLNINEEKTEVGEIVSCPECGVELEIVSVGPICVAKAPEEKEDWGE